jgi:hypothetical protein
MATRVKMYNHNTGIPRDGYFGFSWTYLFFGFFVPLLRGNYKIALFHFLIWFFSITFMVFWFVQPLLAFFFNRFYTLDLIENGYVFMDEPELVEEARRALKLK